MWLLHVLEMRSHLDGSCRQSKGFVFFGEERLQVLLVIPLFCSDVFAYTAGHCLLASGFFPNRENGLAPEAHSS